VSTTDIRARHPEHFAKADALRVLAMDAVEAANSGHPGMPMGMADVATVLFEKHLKFDAAAPNWPDRDRFILSAGHGSMLLYGLLHLTGVEGMDIDQIRNFRQIGAKTAGHPEFGHAKGIETTTGPLGQGLANAVGFAMAEENLAARFSRRIVDHFTYVIAGDGCLMEGISQEAIGLAGMQKLSRLIVLWDDNGISIDGEVSKSDITDQRMRFEASGWDVFKCDGHDPASINAAIEAAKKSAGPAMVACKTHIGLGAPTKQDTAKAHGSPLGAEEITAARAAYGWTAAPFDIPADIKSAWAAIGGQGAKARGAWEERLASLGSRRQEQFTRMISGELPKSFFSALKRFKKEMSDGAPKVATRKASEMALAVINKALPETIGGSADLTGSNNTLTPDLGIFDPDNRAGRYVHYGIREHGMAAAMNGMALHGGVVPYGGTFLVFTDYARGAIRLSALMGQRVIYVMTHDSIGLGEDGPTHQPVEHFSALRAMPNLNVFRPADVVETAEAWQTAIETPNTPSVIALSRQGLPTFRTKHTSKNNTALGGYVLSDSTAPRKVVLIATGSEVEIAMSAQEQLEAEGIGTRVVSMPCVELFLAQDERYQSRVLPRGAVRIGIEAGVRHGWDTLLMGLRGSEKKADFVGMDGFGASGPAPKLYEHFGITADAVVTRAKARL